VIGFITSFIVKPKYVAKTSFMMDTGKKPGAGGGLSSYLQLAGQLGLFNMGGGFSLDEDKVVEMVKTRQILSMALFKTANINGKKDLLVNHYMVISEMQEDFKSVDSLKDFHFIHEDPTQLTYCEDSVLGLICKDMDQLVTVDKSSKSSILHIEVKSVSPVFAKFFCNELVAAVSSFYIDNKTQKDRQDLASIQHVTDSIADELRNTENRLAEMKDASMNVVKLQGSIDGVRMRRKVEILNAMYMESVKNLELSKFNLQMSSPVIQVIDSPVLPLEKPFEKRLLFKLLLLMVGGITGGLLMASYLVIRDFFKGSAVQQ
jgi:uncharacterized protein involved in exopolysaccharide biosynthesis